MICLGLTVDRRLGLASAAAQPDPAATLGGAQDVLARFSPRVSRLRVTAFGAVTGALLHEELYEVTYARVDFDRPSAFFAVHRPSRLVVVAGWVQSPLLIAVALTRAHGR